MLEQPRQGVLEICERGFQAQLGQDAENAHQGDECKDEADEGLDDLVHRGLLAPAALGPPPRHPPWVRADPLSSAPDQKGRRKAPSVVRTVVGFGESVLQFDGAVGPWFLGRPFLHKYPAASSKVGDEMSRE